MSILLRSVYVVQPGSAFHQQRCDVRLHQGKVQAVEKVLEANLDEREICGTDLWLTPGFTDTYAFFGEPGYEYKETLESGCAAAFAGGFTHVLVQPDTHPVVQTKGEVQAMLSKTAHAAVQVLVAGALTENLAGKDITEMLDMHAAGAIAFSNADHPVADTRAQLLALQYAQQCGALVMHFPQDTYLSKNGQVHEGLVSTRLGLKGIPALAEEMMVARDLSLLRYTGGRLHFSKISSAGSVALIKLAKAEGLQVSCGVAAHHLLLTDEVLPAFDTNYKVVPPLRDASHREALRQAVLDGTIDVICSDHQPEDVEHKFLEFDLARPGVAGIETAFRVVAAAFTEAGDLEKALTALNNRPAALLGIQQPLLAAGAEADFVVFDRAATNEVGSLRSTGINNPFVKTLMPAPVVAVFRNQHQWLAHV
jgi:dihydroorotase